MGILQIPADCRGHDTICRGALAPSTSIRLTFISAAAALSMLAGTTAPSARRPSSHMRLSHVVVDFFFFFLCFQKYKLTRKQAAALINWLLAEGQTSHLEQLTEPARLHVSTLTLIRTRASVQRAVQERGGGTSGYVTAGLLPVWNLRLSGNVS